MDSLGTAWPKLVSKKKKERQNHPPATPKILTLPHICFIHMKHNIQISNCIYQISENQWLIIPDKSIY